MCKGFHIIALGTILGFIGSAQAAEQSPYSSKSKRSKKILAALDKIGIADVRINQLVESVDRNTHDGYLFLAEEHVSSAVADGNIAFRYDLGSPSLRRLELAYTPDDGHYQVRASTEGITFRYHYDFE